MGELDRRELLQGIAGLIGLAALPDRALAAAATRQVPSLGRPTTALVTALADTLVPRTDTPGALQAGVPASFDALMRDWASPAHKAAFLASLAAIDAAAKTATGKSFAVLTPTARKAFLSAYDAEHFAKDGNYAQLKALLISLYYMSEPGATVELRYEHAPGAWEASIPLTPQTRAWAGHNVG